MRPSGRIEREFRDEEGNLHRTDGPAVIYSDGTKKWFQNNRLHREGAPAIEYPDGTGEWWEEGCCLSQWDVQNFKPPPPYRLLSSPARQFPNIPHVPEWVWVGSMIASIIILISMLTTSLEDNTGTIDSMSKQRAQRSTDGLLSERAPFNRQSSVSRSDVIASEDNTGTIDSMSKQRAQRSTDGLLSSHPSSRLPTQNLLPGTNPSSSLGSEQRLLRISEMTIAEQQHHLFHLDYEKEGETHGFTSKDDTAVY